jgi:hypothetical protein
MENQLLFTGCLLIAFAGVCMNSYSTQARKIINYYVVNGKIPKRWDVGIMFANEWTHILGAIFTFGSGAISLIDNSWWVLILVIVGGGILFRILVMIFRQKTQVLSIISLLAGITITIISLT